MDGQAAWDTLAPLLVAPAFTLWGAPVTWAELLASALGLAMVACNLRVHPAAWPLAIASSLLYALVFAQGRLYGQVLLQGFFVAVSCWGWWQWLRGTDAQGQALQVGRLGGRARIGVAAATLLAWPLLALALQAGTDTPVPWLDALPTVASFVGQLLLARKRLENWPVWLGVNVFSVGLFASQGLWPTALLYAVFALLSAVGWRAWAARLAEPPGAGTPRAEHG